MQGSAICLSVRMIDICGDRFRLVALVNQSFELPLSILHLSSSCVTGPTQEQLLLPSLSVSTTYHHSPFKSLFGCVSVVC